MREGGSTHSTQTWCNRQKQSPNGGEPLKARPQMLATLLGSHRMRIDPMKRFLQSLKVRACREERDYKRKSWRRRTLRERTCRWGRGCRKAVGGGVGRCWWGTGRRGTALGRERRCQQRMVGRRALNIEKSFHRLRPKRAKLRRRMEAMGKGLGWQQQSPRRRGLQRSWSPTPTCGWSLFESNVQDESSQTDGKGSVSRQENPRCVYGSQRRQRRNCGRRSSASLILGAVAGRKHGTIRCSSEEERTG